MSKQNQQLTEMQKADRLASALNHVEGSFRRENRPQTAERVRIARIELMASPDAAARLYDIIQQAATKPVVTEHVVTSAEWAEFCEVNRDALLDEHGSFLNAANKARSALGLMMGGGAAPLVRVVFAE